MRIPRCTPAYRPSQDLWGRTDSVQKQGPRRLLSYMQFENHGSEKDGSFKQQI